MKLDMLLGDCLDVLPTLEAGSVHCCVTSPPYWGLRDYGVDDQLGLEATPEEYVAKMVEVFREVRRVLRDDGTLWLNLGDSYNSNPSNQHSDAVGANGSKAIGRRQVRDAPGLKPKDLVGIPWMVAFALRADGWYLRSDIIWAKKNPMPESCTDRPTKSHEYLFLLTKSARYFYDADAIREPHSREWASETVGPGYMTPQQGRRDGGKRQGAEQNSAGRNKRSVWTISTQSYKFAHFATFPEALVLPCILAGTSEEGCCAECGAPWDRTVDVSYVRAPGGTTGRTRDVKEPDGRTDGTGMGGKPTMSRVNTTTGWQPTCECFPPGTPPPTVYRPVPCTVLDPFLGSGTVAKVSQQYGRGFVGCELSAEYLELARDRFKQSRLFA